HGVRVVTFSLGFGPKIVKVQRGETEYCISAVPLGGYVKLAGETVEDELTHAPDEFLSESRWGRFPVYLAGPPLNLLLAWVLLAGVLSRGADIALYQSAPPVIGTIVADGVAARAGMKVGDRVLNVDGQDTPTWEAFEVAVAPKASEPVAITVDRAGQRV